MSKFLPMIIFLYTSLCGVDIPLQKAQTRQFYEFVELNSKVIQLSNAKQSIMSLVDGHIEKYFVEVGSKIKESQPIAQIHSAALSEITSEYLTTKEKLKVSNENYDISKKLYDKGMLSKQELNLQTLETNTLQSNIQKLTSQLDLFGIDAKNLKNPTSTYILYAHSSGTISAILQPLHSVIGKDTPIVSTIKERGFYLQTYLPLEYMHRVKIGQKLTLEYNSLKLNSTVTQILPEVDEKTQRVIFLSSLESDVKNLFVNLYLPSRLYFEENKEYVAVKKSALSFMQNEWVVFMPKEHDEHDKEDNDKKHHKYEKAEYEARVVKIITNDNNFFAVKGLEADEEYVSDKSYYVKSMILKSSLGEHGH